MNSKTCSCGASGPAVVKNGHYRRACDAQYVQRFLCRQCGRHFSSVTGTPRCHQKKRRINHWVYLLLGSQVSMRRIAKLLKVSRGTIDRRLRSLAEESRQRQLRWRDTMLPTGRLQFDDLVTFEHSRLKPVSVSVMVDAEHRRILGTVAASIPASGKTAEKSRQKYGRRPDDSRQARLDLIGSVKHLIACDALVESDEHQDYGVAVRQHLPGCTHVCHPSIRGSLSGQGELKRTGYDPLFCINHTLAMQRYNISRLVRRTWCTTKKIERLQDHLDLYTDFFNRYLRDKYVPACEKSSG